MSAAWAAPPMQIVTAAKVLINDFVPTIASSFTRRPRWSGEFGPKVPAIC
jgi:hypothetical protein